MGYRPRSHAGAPTREVSRLDKDKGARHLSAGRYVRLLVRVALRGAEGLHALPGQALGADRYGRGGALLHRQPRHLDLRLPQRGVWPYRAHQTRDGRDLRQGVLHSARRRTGRPRPPLQVHKERVPQPHVPGAVQFAAPALGDVVRTHLGETLAPETCRRQGTAVHGRRPRAPRALCEAVHEDTQRC